MSFDQLLSDLTGLQDDADAELAKAQAAAEAEDDGKDDAAIAAAADEGESELVDEGEYEDDGEDDGEGEVLGKSLRVTLEDGTEVDAVDGTDLVKSLIQKLDSHEDGVAQALGATVNLIKSQAETIKAQSELAKSLKAEMASLKGTIAKLSTEGRGRKATLAIVERQTAALAKSQAVEDPPSREEILAKAIDAQRAGKIGGLDVARCESALNHGLQVPADILAKL